MARKGKPKIKEEDLHGFKHFKLLVPVLETLHHDACQRDKAGNRKLHFDQYTALILLYFFNPIVTSLRGIQQSSELKKVQRIPGCPRASLGSLSEAARVFDPDLLGGIIGELIERLPPIHHNPSFDDLMDRGYTDFALFCAILDIGSSLVCRVPDRTVFEVIEERKLSAEARTANIVRDAVVRFTGVPATRVGLSRPMRIVEVKCKPHRKPSGKTGRGGPEQGETLLIATDLLDLPAEVIALIYKHRWAVETFFRFFKHVLGCRHLLSHSPNGIAIQTYAAIIACLLIALWTGKKPTLRTYEMICFYFTGLADEEELLAHIEKLAPQT